MKAFRYIYKNNSIRSKEIQIQLRLDLAIYCDLTQYEVDIMRLRTKS